MSILIPLTRIEDSPWQTRQAYDEEYIAELAADIERNGLLQAPVARIVNGVGHCFSGRDDVLAALKEERNGDRLAMRRLLDEHPGWRVELAFGHNRKRAYEYNHEREEKTRNFEFFPIEHRHLTDEQMATLAWAENERRKDLTPVEEALAIEKRMQDFDWTQKQVAEELGIGRSTVANKLRLLKLPEEVLGHVRAGELSERQAQALLPVVQMTDEEQRAIEGVRYFTYSIGDLIKRGMEDNWSSSRIRKAAKSTIEAAHKQIECEERERENARKVKEAIAPSGDGDGEVIKLADLKWDQYDCTSDDPDDYNHVEGCSPDCECRTQALDVRGEITPVCLDPKHRKKLARAAKRRAREQRQEEADEKLAAFREKYFEGQAVRWTPAAVRLIAKNALYRPNAKDIRAALDELEEDDLIDEAQREALGGLAGGTWSNRDPGLDALEELGMDTALRLMLLALIQKDLRHYVYDDHSARNVEAVMAGEPYAAEDLPAPFISDAVMDILAGDGQAVGEPMEALTTEEPTSEARKTDADAPPRREAFNQPELSALELAVLRKADAFHSGYFDKDFFEEGLSEKECGAVGRLMQLGHLSTAWDGRLKVAPKADKVLESSDEEEAAV